MKILLLSDQDAGSNHSAVEGLFNKALRRHADVSIVYFSRQATSITPEGSNFIAPHITRRFGFFRRARNVLPLADYHFIVVRNLFPLLKQTIAWRARYRYRVGFWESFPHSFRRIYEARETGQSVLRKSWEYRFKSLRERRLISACDCYFPITEAFKADFRSQINIPYLPLPMGIDVATLPRPAEDMAATGPIRFAYVGTIDRLRRMDVVIEAFLETRRNFELNIYPARENETVAELRGLGDARIRVHRPLPRDKLFASVSKCDVALGFYPDSLLYRSVSPTKILEYYALGIPAIMNHLPECDELFGEGCAFFCAFNRKDISRTIVDISDRPRSELVEMGRTGRDIVLARRDYRVIAANLIRFLERLAP